MIDFKSDSYTFHHLDDYIQTLKKGPLRIPKWAFKEFGIIPESCTHIHAWTNDAYKRVEQAVQIASTTPRKEWPGHLTYSILLELYACSKYEDIPGLTTKMMKGFGYNSFKELESSVVNYRDQCNARDV